jgi:hypothetical protein
MSNQTDETTGEFIELYNGTDAPIDVAGWTIDDGDLVDTIRAWQGGSTVVPAQTYAVVLDPDFPAAQIAIQIDPNAILLSVNDSAIGNGLGTSDPITLRSGTNIVDSYTRTLRATDGKSIEKVSLSMGDTVGNWAQSSCSTGSSPGRLNCVSSASAGPKKPLAITEVMANPLDEDTGEFIEIYNRGIEPVDAAGLLFSDGDAVDVLVGWQGGPTSIPAGGYAVILDREYAGEYDIPSGAVRLTTPDTTIGSGLGLDDALRLLESNGVEIIDTFRFPFNPGNGRSAERIDVRAFDTAANWTASTCASFSSPGKNNCAATPAGLPKQIRITEVMANQAGNETGGAGEFVELFNFGERSVDLAGMYLEVGPEQSPSRDQLLAWQGGATVLTPGAYALIVDPQFTDQYTFPAGTVLVTLDDSAFGASGITTGSWATLYDADGITLLDRFKYPSDPGDGVSLFRVSLTATDSAANWMATPCNKTPGAGACPGGAEVTSYTSFWADRYRDESGIAWVQAIGWPSWHDPDCEFEIVCDGPNNNYHYRDNFFAPVAFAFTNPYPRDYAVHFEERSSPTDDCGGRSGDGCAGGSFTVQPGQTAQVPASALGYYYAQSVGPELNTLDWFGGDENLYWALPPDGTLAPFTVEVPK